jgi:6-phosphofructokinase 1
MIYASSVDLDEAYEVGRHAVTIAVESGSGWMSTILRKQGTEYEVSYDKVPLEAVANSERSFPRQWLSANGTDVTDDFVSYARPLIGDEWVNVPLENGVQRFSRFNPVFADQVCGQYVPEGHR